MTQDPFNYQAAFDNYQNAVAGGAASAEATKAAVDANNASDIDMGNVIPMFNPTDEGQYVVRVLPRFDCPSQWWQTVQQYTYGPVGLTRGLSPSVFGERDEFKDYIDASFPYDKDNKVSTDYRKLRPKKRVLCMVMVRHYQGYKGESYDPNTIYVWSIPYFKSGFQDFFEPTINAMALQRDPTTGAPVNPVDPNVGFDLTFQITGKKWDRKTLGVNFLSGQPGPILPDMNLFGQLFNDQLCAGGQFMTLEQTFKRMTQEDCREYIEYYRSSVEMVQMAPHLHVDPGNAQCKAAADQWVRNQQAGPQQQQQTMPTAPPPMAGAVPPNMAGGGPAMPPPPHAPQAPVPAAPPAAPMADPSAPPPQMAGLPMPPPNVAGGPVPAAMPPMAPGVPQMPPAPAPMMPPNPAPQPLGGQPPQPVPVPQVPQAPQPLGGQPPQPGFPPAPPPAQ